MCCEQEECYVAVFDETEASCYLKGAGALNTYDFVSEEGFVSNEILFREGESAFVVLLYGTAPVRLAYVTVHHLMP